jgi:hypothetical protein
MRKILFTLLSLLASTLSSVAQSTSYRMNVQTLDGNVFSVNADSVTRVYFTTDGKSSGLSDYSISGSVEKGPFLSGSSINIQPIDERLFSLGGLYTTSTSNACGEYNINIAKMPTSTVLLTANGSYYDEDYHEVSKDRITLNAIVDLSKGGKHNINILTNFKYYRIVKLVQNGLTLSAAREQAQKELLNAFGLSKYNNKDVSSFSLQNNDDGAGILTALSMLLLRDRHHEGEFSNYLSKLVKDFADDGQFNAENKQQLATDRDNLSFEDNVKYLVDYYKEQGVDIAIPSLYKYFDWDNDGIAGDEIYDGTQSFTMDASEINSPYTGGTYTINIQSTIPFYTYKHGELTSVVVGGYDFYSTSPSIHYSLNDKVLTVTVAPTNSCKSGSAIIQLYDITGTVLGTVTINQLANPNGSILSSYGQEMVNSVRSSNSKAVEKYNYIDAAYTNQIQNSNLKAPVSTSNYDINSMWNYSYDAINRLNRIGQWCDEHNDETLKPMKYIYSGLLYANLINFFGDVPYITNTDYNYNAPRTQASTIFSDLITNIQSSFSKLSTDSVSHNSYDGFAFPTVYAAYAVAADIDLALGDYQKARDLLLNIVNSGKYGYSNNIDKNSNELIIAYPKIVETEASDSSMIPAETYTDVMLKLAECEYHIGNTQKANEYVNSVAAAKSVELNSENTIENIKSLRNKILSGMGGYFAFLKRNGLAISELGLKDYQLLLPIPWEALNMNYNLCQNPGY